MDGYGPICHVRQRRQRDVLTLEHHMLVDVVGQRDDIEFLAQVGDQLQLRASEDFPGRVVR